MREIKFRVWDKQTKKMWYSDGTLLPMKITFAPSYILCRGKSGYDPSADLLMQYTGLKNKNDKEIYEGDILKFDTIFSEREVKNNKGTTSRVFWAGTGFYVRGTSYSCTLDKAINIKIIGNIYENPELLKEEPK